MKVKVFLFVVCGSIVMTWAGLAVGHQHHEHADHEIQAHQASIRMGTGATYFTEKCVFLGAGTKLTYHFDAPKPLDFNIHVHLTEKTIYPVKAENVAQYHAQLTASESQEYCFTWHAREKSAREWYFDFGYEPVPEQTPQ
ncbi:hypothetical protein [Marinobacter nanhaiticus]|nr:hypothetical protein [Marinobacter nanhaiticus]